MTATPDTTTTATLSPQRIGSIGERLAGERLTAQGYRIAARNYRCPWGEIDLIAQQGPTWVFVEVRTRRTNTYGAPEESLTPHKARRLTLTAQHYLQNHVLPSHNAAPEPDWRIDLIAIRLGPNRRILSINHLQNAVAA